jgi:hypothetical protein
MKCSNPDCTCGIGLSSIGAAGSASGATVQSVAVMPSWIMHQSYNKSEMRRPTSNGLFLHPIENSQSKLKPAVDGTKAY